MSHRSIDRSGPIFEYPWPGLEEHVAGALGGVLPMLGYGSLMNAASAARTLRCAPTTPLVAEGVRRVFDHPMEAGSLARYGPPPTPQHTAALGVHPTGDPRDTTNGLLLEVSLSDLAAFREREVGYRLIEVAAKRWESPESGALPVFILESSGVPDLLPHTGYLKVCLEGANSVSRRFGEAFLATTYLADGRLLADEAGSFT